jgi:hypothetical protein
MSNWNWEVTPEILMHYTKSARDLDRVRTNFPKTFASKRKVYSLSNPTDQIRIRNDYPLAIGVYTSSEKLISSQPILMTLYASPMYLASFFSSQFPELWGLAPQHGEVHLATQCSWTL